ncbi:DotU family type IV/VI secretion system protein [Pirellulales bacterium]|nr:DotU family type IV/VI secretion system protein [Pirellulales bacterium]
MTPKFAQAVDPIFLYVLALLDRISRDEKPKPEEERLRIRTLIDQAEAALGSGGEWELAKYALVSWVDEMLVDALWDGREWWSNNVLEIDLFNSRQCNEEFFVKAQQATARTGRDALEVFYVCVILGFRGLYHESTTSREIALALNLPAELKDWTRQAAMSIRLGQGRPPLSDPGAEIEGAAPLRPRARVVWPWLVALLLGAIVVVVGYHQYG